ncbi:MAG: hypothetical protein IJS25_00915, partial [Bacteroidales bacterium]|nr:hypothetical protein [Bacteroidales bacterium]
MSEAKVCRGKPAGTRPNSLPEQDRTACRNKTEQPAGKAGQTLAARGYEREGPAAKPWEG